MQRPTRIVASHVEEGTNDVTINIREGMTDLEIGVFILQQLTMYPLNSGDSFRGYSLTLKSLTLEFGEDK